VDCRVAPVVGLTKAPSRTSQGADGSQAVRLTTTDTLGLAAAFGL